MVQYRDIIQRQENKFEKKQDKKGYIKAVITDALGNTSGAGDVWYDRNTRRIWIQENGSASLSQVPCYKITPAIGLGVIVGYEPYSTIREVLATDREFFGPTNSTGTSYESPSNEDFLPGGRLQLWLDSRLFQPLATYPDNTGLVVNVVAGYYPYIGTRKLFLGQTGYDISAYQPAGPNEHCLVGLYLDSANSLQVVAGATVSTAVTAPEPTWPSGAFRLSVILLDDTQTSIDFVNDVFDRRMAWSDENSGGWPFAHVLTVSTTDPDADYTNLAAAVAASVDGDTIELDSETFTLAAAISTNKTLKFRGQGLDKTVVHLSGAGYALTFTGAVSKIAFDNIQILHDGSSSGGAIEMTHGSELVVLNSYIRSQTSGVTTSIAIACDEEIPVYVLGSRIIGTSIGGTGVGIDFAALAIPHIFADSGSIFTATTASIKTLTAGGEILLSGPHLSGALSLVGDWFGWYVDSNDDVIIKSYRADVRLHEASSGLSIDYTTIQGAIDAMAAGDIIEVGAGTDTGGIVPDTAGSIVGLSPVETIITASANDSITVDNSAGTDNLTLENLTVANTGAGTSVACIQSNKDGLRLYELVINKVSGTPTNSTGVSVYGGSGAGTYLRNCKIAISTGTNKYGVYASTAACNIVIEGGEINAATADIYIGHASAVIELRGPKLLGGGINNASGGTVKGWYYNSSGDIVFVGTSVVSGIDKAKVSKLRESDDGANALTADASGYLSATSQPLVSAYRSSVVDNVTGDGTQYTIIFDTEIVDRNSNYNNSTGVFTAPVTGKYLIVTAALAKEIAAAHNLMNVIINTSNRSYYNAYLNPFPVVGAGGFYQGMGMTIADMDASDTASVDLYVAGGTKVVDLYGAAALYTYLMVYLLP